MAENITNLKAKKDKFAAFTPATGKWRRLKPTFIGLSLADMHRTMLTATETLPKDFTAKPLALPNESRQDELERRAREMDLRQNTSEYELIDVEQKQSRHRSQRRFPHQQS